MAKESKQNKVATKIISFRVSTELYAKLEKLSKTELDEAGLTLNASTYARRLMLRALEKEKK